MPVGCDQICVESKRVPGVSDEGIVKKNNDKEENKNSKATNTVGFLPVTQDGVERAFEYW